MRSIEKFFILFSLATLTVTYNVCYLFHSLSADPNPEISDNRLPAIKDIEKNGAFLFEKKSYQVAKPDFIRLQKLAEYLITSKNTIIHIQGHAWDGGNKNQELNLSEKRSLEVERFLLIHGVKEEQIHRLFYGNTRPISHGFTAHDSALLRRVEFDLIIE